MQLFSRRVRVRVIKDEKDRMDKWAIDTCNGEKVSETLNLRTGKRECVYRFGSVEMKEEFLRGLEPNFGSAVQVI